MIIYIIVQNKDMVMGLFDLFSKKKAEPEDAEMRMQLAAFREDFLKLQKQVTTINGDLDALYENVRNIAENRDDSKIKQSVSALESRMKEMIAFARLSVQNHDEIQKLKRNSPASTPTIKEKPERGEIGAIKDMSPKEREIVGILLNSEIPLSNTEISSRMGISPITVKGHLNSIKKRYGGIILEIARGRNKKEYQLDRALRVRVLEGN